jgi:hypothetical protein
MSRLVQQFQQFAGQGTRQIGRYFCIPATVSNALRVLGGADFTQERIRDEWYAHHGRIAEANLDEQMMGAGPNVIDVLRQRTDFSSRFDMESFDLPRELSLFDSGKADQTMTFVTKHVTQEHPVLVSTDRIPWEQGILSRLCCHMWLVLSVDTSGNRAIAHDPGTDVLFEVAIQMAVPLQMGTTVVGLEIGLRGRLTTSNYFCVAFWKR